MPPQWGLGIPQQDVGQRVLMGIQLGRQHRQENELLQRQRGVDEALRGIATNPNDPNSMNALIQADPRLAIQYQQQQASQQQQQQQQVREAASLLAPVYRRMAGMPYEQRRQYLQQVGPRLVQRGIPAEVVASYDPTDENLQTDLDLSERNADPTQMQRNYEWLQQLDPAAAGQYLRRQTEPLPRYVTRPDGSVVQIAPAAEGGEDEWEYGPPPAGQGGAGPSGPRNFR